MHTPMYLDPIWIFKYMFRIFRYFSSVSILHIHAPMLYGYGYEYRT